MPLPGNTRAGTRHVKDEGASQQAGRIVALCGAVVARHAVASNPHEAECSACKRVRASNSRAEGRLRFEEAERRGPW